MLSLIGYKNLSLIHESANSEVYRCHRESDNQPVVLKILKQNYVKSSKLTKYKQEFEILRSLDTQGVIKAHSLENYQRTAIIILEDFAADSLKKWLAETQFSLKEFLNIALLIVNSLGNIHDRNIIHKDINPANILFNPKTGELKIIDFGIATALTQENPSLKNINILEGTLAYISPEQTGRMNCSLDYRTDYYSLGVTFYELLTQELPFTNQDPLELIHCHLAKQPLAPHQIDPKIPPILSAIVMKLMAKTAEARYQSSYGIKADLQECLRQLTLSGNIQEFPLATQDIISKFKIPQKLYGRELEIAHLLESFERISNSTHRGAATSELMLIDGYSGVGKTALVKEIYKPLSEKRGYFISGKFDQLQRNIPYSAIVSAFSELIQQLLSESIAQLEQWRHKLLNNLGINAQIMIEVIPELELIIGPQPETAILGSIESQNRFNLVFQSLITAFCDPEHPLVIFLDDLQWADIASLKFIELILSQQNTQHLLLIGAYRNNEVSATHPLMRIVGNLNQTKVKINRINLKPLEVTSVTQLIAETIHRDYQSVRPLAELVFSKTHGNPFFVNQFIKTLYRENLLVFQTPQSSGQKVGWQWDMDQLKALNITDNVVELTLAQLKKLSPATQNLLLIAASIGSEFTLKTLSIICERPAPEIFTELKNLLNSGLIVALSRLDENLLIQHYKFAHDRIQQAAYVLADEKEKQSIHLKIGRLLLQDKTEEELGEHIFAIVEQLNRGINLIEDFLEKKLLAILNLTAAERAKAATAYEAAREYLKIARQLLSQNNWQTDYELTLNIYTEIVEVAYLRGDFTLMEEVAMEVFDQAHTLLDKVRVYEIQIEAYIAQNQNLEAIQTALPILQLLGVVLPTNPTESDVQAEFQQTQSNLQAYAIANLSNLPVMSDRSTLAAVAIMHRIVPSTYIAAPTLLPLIIFKQINLFLKYGNTSLSAVTYVFYGLILCSMADDIGQGYSFGQLALEILERFGAQELYANIVAVLYATIQHWKESLRKSLEPLKFSYQRGLETGDLYHGTTSSYLYAFHAVFSGQELTTLASEVQVYNDACRKFKQDITLNYNQIYAQLIFNLVEIKEEPCLLIGEAYDEEMMLPFHLQANDRYALCALYVNKLYLALLFDDRSLATTHANHAVQYLDGATSTLLVPLFHFYDSLAQLAIYDLSCELQQPQIRERVRLNQSKLENWAKYAPMNYLHKFHLVAAEWHRVQGDYLQAIDCYELAIAKAQEQQFVNDEALATELAGKFYLAWGKRKIAQTYLNDAYYLYLHWGAKAKAKHLAQRYGWLISSPSTMGAYLTEQVTINFDVTTDSETGDSLDLATVMKASQAISGEILLEKLLANLMRILIENAGAERGYLILNSDGELLIEAIGAIAQENIQVMQSMTITDNLPTSIINYVARTRETVLEHHIAERGKFTEDPYIKAQETKSVLCTPLIDRGQLTGIIYLENNLTTRAFTPKRLKILQLLSGQAAIAISNAKLYKELQENQRRLTQFLDAMPIGVTIHEPDGQVYYSNRQAKHLLGMNILPQASSEELSQTYQIYQAGTQELYPTEKLPVVRALYGETIKVDDVEIHHSDKIVPLEVSTTPIFNKLDQIEYAIATFQDISDRKQAEQLLANYNKTLENQVTIRTQELSLALEELKTAQKQLVESEKMASLGGLVAGVAHEINTPIGIGVTAASTLEEKTIEFNEIYRSGKMKRSQLEKFLDIAVRSSNMVLSNLHRAAELIHSFKKVAVDQSSESKRSFQLKSYIREILISLAPKLKRTKHQINLLG
ncbi:MAG: AAA family ATPase, partial [Cyanobacteria bacterium P01_F01_bin.143]